LRNTEQPSVLFSLSHLQEAPNRRWNEKSFITWQPTLLNTLFHSFRSADKCFVLHRKILLTIHNMTTPAFVCTIGNPKLNRSSNIERAKGPGQMNAIECNILLEHLIVP
jgi:hypothetical protein